MNKLYTFILIFQFLDMLTGVIQAFYMNIFSSAKLREGAFKKIFVWLAIATSFFIQEWIGVKFLNYVCNIFIGYEVTSIIENLGRLDVNMDIFPNNVKNILASFKVVDYNEKKPINKNILRKEENDKEIK